MYDITALGELLIDFTPVSVPGQTNPLFLQNPGGAPANVLAAASKCGLSTAFIGKVGQDAFGQFLHRTLEENRIDAKGLIFARDYKTTLAFVHLDEHGDRSFSFYRNPGADLMLSPDEINYAIIKNSKVFHFGSVSMTDDPSKTATISAAQFAAENGILVSFDPNLRPALWESTSAAKSVILSAMPYTDILKLSDDELTFLTGTDDIEKGARMLEETYGLSVIAVTCGEKGAYLRALSKTVNLPAPNVNTIDTTGAGDAFFGALLYQIIQSELLASPFSDAKLSEILKFSITAGSLATTKKGAIPAIPSQHEIEAFLSHQGM